MVMAFGWSETSWLSFARAAEPEFGLKQRVAWTNDRLTGFPDPLPPYRVKQIAPQVAEKRLLSVGTFPGSRWMWFTNHDADYGGPSRIFRFLPEDPNIAPEVIYEQPDIIYGIAFHPRFAENGLVFIGCNGKSEKLNVVATKVLRGKMNPTAPFRLDKDSVEVVIEWPSNGHNGGDLAFDKEGLLFVTAGDGTSDSDGNLTGQDLTNIEGSVIRIDVDRPDGERLYSIPAGNPFVSLEGAKHEIWAFGLRNPWRLTYDAHSDQLWTGNNGQDLWETVHLVRRGENYGWSVTEGSHPFQTGRKLGPVAITPPTVEHPHSEARSLTGGIVYRGKRYPDLIGAYIYADYATGNIWGVKHDGTRVTWNGHLARTVLQISGMGSDPDGELVIVDHEGALYGIEPQSPMGKAPPFPTKLSQTGLFVNTAREEVHPGLVPYSVQSPLWSDGAEKARWMAVPVGKQIDYTDSWGWNFPSESVLVKTFSLPLAEREQVITKRVETRIMVKVDKEWFGYSYAWRDDQTDADLIAAGGEDRTFRVVDGDTVKNASDLRWRFPSRIECMVCHSRAANYVLGLSTSQMNRSHDYGGVSDNQMRSLAHVGLLKLPAVGGKTASSADSNAPQESPGELPKPADEYKRLADPKDTTASLEARVRSYLQANCAHCHTNAGGGNSRMELQAEIKIEKMAILDQVPQHDMFGIEGGRVIAPGAPNQSLLLHRVSKRGPGQMPPLATHRVDPVGVALLREWIESLDKPSIEK